MTHPLADAPAPPTPLAALVAHPAASLLELGGDRPFAVAGDVLWVVARGWVDVFAVPSGPDGAPGARRHVARVGAGALVVGAADAAAAPDGSPLLDPSDAPPPDAAALPPVRLLGVGSVDALAWAVPHAAAGDAPAAWPALRAALEGWAAALWPTLAPAAAPRDAPELAAGPAHPLAPGEAVRAGHAPLWAQGDGALLPGGDPALAWPAGRALPLARPGWLSAPSGGAVRVVEPTPADVWAAVRTLHALVVRAAARRVVREAERERERERRRVEERASVLAGAVHTLAAAMRPHGPARPAARAFARAPGAYDVLLAAMREVAGASGIPIVAPRNAAWVGTEEPVDAVARASRCRTRRVMLRGRWWTHDAGPLLGMREGAPGSEAREAVALLPATTGGYDMVRPAHGHARTRVTAATAAELLPLATAFYRPLPNAALGLADVLRFAMRGSWHDVAAVVAFGAAGGGLALLVPMATGLLFDTVIPGADRGQLRQLTALLVLVALAIAAFELSRAIALLRIEGRMQVTVQAALWDRLLALPTTFFRTYTSGDLAVRAMSIDGIRQLLTGTVVTALVGGVFTALNLGVMFGYSPPLAWRGALVILLALLVTVAAGALQLGAQRRTSELRARASGLVLQLLTSVAKLRVAGAEVRAFARWATAFGEQRRQQYVSRLVRIAYATITAVLPLVASVVVFAALARMMDEAAAATAAGLPAPPVPKTGEFLAFLAAFMTCLMGTIATGSAVITALGIVPLYEQARPIFAAAPEVGESRRDPGVLEGDVEAQDLRLRYTPDGPLVLDGLSFRARPGECLALVGPSGSGKSTVLRALLGFEPLESGAIYLDGHDLAGLDVQAVRRQIGVVLQHSRLNAGDVFGNIVGASMATEQDAWAAAEMAGLAEDLRRMPMGMNTVVSEGGGTLSGGQRQRLLIARALVNRPRIVILDEATSALDNRTQQIVTESLTALRATRLVVAHRLSTVLHADRILVIQRGRVTESGTYDALMRTDGAFRELARRQLR